MPSEEGQRSKLSLHSAGVDKSNEKITISIKKLKNLVNQKPEGLTLYAKIEFNENQIAETPKILITPDNVSDFNYSTTLSINPNDSVCLDDLAYKPVIVTLIEVLPKEKKQKEEKVQNYGQSVFELYSLLKGELNYTVKLPVYPTPGSTLEQQSSDTQLPELEVQVSIEQPILNEEDSSKCNLMTVSLESMYALPETWMNTAREYAYTVSLPIPVNDDKDSAVAFVNGLQKAPTDPFVKQKRLGDTRGIQAAQAIYTSQVNLPDDPSVEDLGDFNSKEEKEYRGTSEREKPRISWNTERRCFLNQTSNKVLKDQLMKSRYLPVEIVRTMVPTGAKGKRDEDLAMSYHGVAYVDMAHLLYPGATRIKGAFKIQPYSDQEYSTRTKRKLGLVDETLKVINNMYDRNFAIMPQKKDSKQSEKKETKKGPRESNAEGHDLSQSVQQILESKSFIVIDIKFDKPLIARKPFDQLAKKVNELIPPRPKYPIRTNSAEKAVGDYHSQIKTIVNSIISDYRNLPDGQEVAKETDYDTRRRKLLYELNSSGKYFAFKEQLKNSVIKIVREKFLKTSSLTDQEELQQFLSELYVFLQDELHKSLNDILTIEDSTVVDNNMTDIQQMKHFALEAEMNRNFDLAAYYYQERIAGEKDNYTNWLDYAVFNLLIEDYARCEECLKECISIDQNEISGLLMQSIICAMQEKNEMAELFLERVTAQDEDNLIAWTLYAMLYEQMGQELNAEITFKKAHKMNHAQHTQDVEVSNIERELQASALKKAEEEGNEDNDIMSKSEHTANKENRSRLSKRGTITQSTQKLLPSKSPKPNNLSKISDITKKELEMPSYKSIFIVTADFLLKYNAFTWAEKCIAKELVYRFGGPSCYYHTVLTKIKLAKNNLEDAERHCADALTFDYQCVEAWILWSHIRYLSGDFKGAKERYERVLQFPELPKDQTHAIYIRLASIYLKEENYEDSKRLFLYPCKFSPSCMSWLGVGICCFRMEQLEEAKNALCEANILNNKAPEVWAYLSLICLCTNKPLEAEQAYKYAMKLNLDNPELLEEIQQLQEKVGFGNPEF